MAARNVEQTSLDVAHELTKSRKPTVEDFRRQCRHEELIDAPLVAGSNWRSRPSAVTQPQGSGRQPRSARCPSRAAAERAGSASSWRPDTVPA